MTIYPENIKVVYDGTSKTTTKGRGDNLLENDQVSIVSTLSPVNVGTYENSVKEGSVVITATMHNHQTITATKEITITLQA